MQKYEHSYLFETRHLNGMVKLWNGYYEREGGLSSMNDARTRVGPAQQLRNGLRDGTRGLLRGQHGARAEENATRERMVEQGDVWAARELLMSYGKAFWTKQQEPTK